MRAAEYVRMSTEHQRYSIENQQNALAQYARENGLEIVATYADPGRSGLTLERRPGLRRLLADILAGQDRYQVLLIYDVSRWGRFQDTDESAHYEYLIRRAGVRVVYCAEPFENDGGAYSAIVKNLKRTLAGEYSREMSVKIRAARHRAVAQGHWQGVQVGIGLRRMTVDARGNRRDILKPNQRKSFPTDHIILVPGPPEEVAAVRRVFELFVERRRPLTQIAAWLTAQGLVHPYGRAWNPDIVRRMLSNEAYIGTLVSRKFAGRIGEIYRLQPEHLWQRLEGAYEPIVERDLFNRAQAILARKGRKLTDEQLLDELRVFWAQVGRLSLDLIRTNPHCAAPSVYRRRFGGLLNAFERIGYASGQDFSHVKRRRPERRTMLVDDITNGYWDRGVEVDNAPYRRLLVNGEVVVSTHVLTRWTGINRSSYWLLDTRSKNIVSLFVVLRLDPDGQDVMDYLVVPSPMTPQPRFYIQAVPKPPFDRFRFDNLDPLFELRTQADVDAYRAQGDQRWC